jgi:hypothetical protein
MMKKTHVVVLFLMAVLLCSAFLVNAADISPVANYFPLAVGNQWAYIRVGQTIDTVQKILVDVSAKMTPPGSTEVYYQLNNYNGQTHWVRQDASGVVSEYLRNSSSEYSQNLLWYIFNAEAGKSWTMRIDTSVPGVIPGSNGATLTVISRNETVKVPAGVFYNAIHIQFRTNVMDAGITDEWFAAGVGLVKRVETSFVGPVTTELKQAVIGGIIIENPLVTTSVKTDQPVYWENHMPGPGPVPTLGPVITIYCTVTPINGQTVTLNFSDYNVWNVTITNPKGRVVWTNPMIMALAPIGGVNRQIPGTGQTDKFQAQLSYGSMEGQYLVTAKLLVSKNAPPDATTTFQYSWAW